MTTKVNNVPQLPLTSATSAFESDLLRTLLTELSAHAYRLNLSLPQDGSEAMTLPLPLARFKVTTLPKANLWTGAIAFVSDGTLNKRLVVSDGTNWRFPDGNIVS